MATYGITFYQFNAEGEILEHHEISPYDFTFECEEIEDLKETAEIAQAQMGYNLEIYENEVFQVMEIGGIWMEIRKHDLGTYWAPWTPWEG